MAIDTVVFLFSVTSFFSLRSEADQAPLECLFLTSVTCFLFDKEFGLASATVHTSLRDNSYQVRVSFSDLRAEEFKTRRKMKVRTRKLKFSVSCKKYSFLAENLILKKDESPFM